MPVYSPMFSGLNSAETVMSLPEKMFPGRVNSYRSSMGLLSLSLTYVMLLPSVSFVVVEVPSLPL